MEIVSKMVIALALLGALVASSGIENEVSEPARESRAGGIIKTLLPFINLKIKNPSECLPGTSVNGYPVVGTCMSPYDCSRLRGTIDGECASGYGRCCILYANCGETIMRNRTYLVSNNTAATTCSYTINKERLDFKSTNKVMAAIGACQVRLDFEEFTIGPPSVINSLCSEDSFTITGNQNAAFGRICGNNQGQHIYLPINPTSNTIATITITRGTYPASSVSATSPTTFNRNWRIRTTYIPCLSNMTAPQGCLQYYTEDTGVIKSFNYVGVLAPAATTEIAGLRYSACISDKVGSCGVNFALTTTTPPSFHISGAAAGTSSTGAATCNTDYVAFLSVDNLGVPRESYYCGGNIPVAGATGGNPFSTYARPFTVLVRTDLLETATEVNTGFSLTYSRLSC